MATIILFRSRYGCVEKAALQLQKLINDDLINVVNLKKNPNPDISVFRTIIIGGSIHFGKIQKTITEFCKKNHDLLLMKRLGLYLCCIEENEKAEQQFNDAYPERLRNKALATGFFGGEIDFKKLNIIERLLARKAVDISTNTPKISQKAIKEFAEKMAGKNRI